MVCGVCGVYWDKSLNYSVAVFMVYRDGSLNYIFAVLVMFIRIGV